LLPPVIILGCGLAAGALISLGGQAEKTPPEVTPTLVLVQTLVPEDTTALVQATGVVQPARQVTIVPQVAGKVEEVSAQLVPGGRVSQGDLLAMIEQRDYLAAHAQAQSQLRQAELELALERGRATTAKREWDMLHSDGKAPRQSSLALREPHLEVAKARVRAAQAAVRQAEANISRTRLRAPFSAVVVTENVDVGQVVGPATPIATLVGTEKLWVTVSVPMTALADLQLPSGAVPGSPAKVIHRLGDGEQIIHQGRLMRLAGRLDAQTRQAQVTVAVDSPFDPVDGAVPLLPGTYVEVEIQGKPMPQVFRVPRSAVHEGSRVWVVDEDTLAPREVTIDGGDTNTVLVVGGLTAGDALVTSSLSLPVPGQPVEILSPNDGGEE
jgi:RND family efflux transporter MFP subunit